VLAACQAIIGDPAESAVAGGADAGGDDDPVPGDPDAAPVPPAPDAAPVTPTPDAAPTLTPEQECALRYGAVPGFVLCTATDTCTFIATNGDTSCGAHCAAAGGVCLSALDNDVGSCVDLEANPTATCETTGKIDLLCTCTR
jgi:hypothetical protein